MCPVLSALRRFLPGADRRRYPRIRGGDVEVRLGEQPAEVVDWSPGGIRINAPAGTALRPGAVLKGDIRMGATTGPFIACVVTTYPDGSVGARFDEIDTGVFRALASWRP